MTISSLSCLILSDFNCVNLAGYLNHSTDEACISISASCGPYGQVQSLMTDEKALCWSNKPDILVVWTLPESISSNYCMALKYEPANLDKLMQEVDQFIELLRLSADRAGCVLIPTWNKPYFHRGFGMLDCKQGFGLTDLLTRMNLRLAEKLDDLPNCFVLDSTRWLIAAGKYSINPKLWYMGKIPYNHEVFQIAAKDILATIGGIKGKARKMIIVDLDDTLWGGIVGDVGWENLQLGGHDPIGEAFVDFQKELKSFTHRGILLGIVSKNDETVALSAIRNHPEMILREDDFTGWRINWEDKAQNVIDLVDELNLGLQSVVFIDDNPAERARVAEALPEVHVPDWPKDKMMYRRSLLELDCFDQPIISSEDAVRAAMYNTERKRDHLKKEIGSAEEWLKSLKLRVIFEEMKPENQARIIQLLNKTNQMNLSTRRLSLLDLESWLKEKDGQLWTVRVSDRFGDSGLTGILSFYKDGMELKIIDFILSCRVFGRQIEHLMIGKVFNEANSQECSCITMEYIQSEKNKPMKDFLVSLNLDQNGTFFNRKVDSGSFLMPDHIEVSCDLG